MEKNSSQDQDEVSKLLMAYQVKITALQSKLEDLQVVIREN
jgi:hypothetical protein